MVPSCPWGNAVPQLREEEYVCDNKTSDSQEAGPGTQELAHAGYQRGPSQTRLSVLPLLSLPVVNAAAVTLQR